MVTSLGKTNAGDGTTLKNSHCAAPVSHVRIGMELTHSLSLQTKILTCRQSMEDMVVVV